jgi:predicted RNase H-like HicB family nuclease
MASYIALIHKDADSDFGVSFPDFPGCVSAGDTLDEARRAAEEALALHVEGMIEDGEALPAPSSMEQVMKDRAALDAVAFLVPLPERAAPTVRVNITLPAADLAAIDAYAESNGFTRSGFIVAAARRTMRKDKAA